MANNTTWNFNGLPDGSSILSYSPQIPGVNFALVNSDGVNTKLNAGGTPSTQGTWTTTLRVGTYSCYKDVQVTLTANPASPASPPPRSCAVALAEGTSTYGLTVDLTNTYATFSVTRDMQLFITPSEFGTFSFSYVSGQQIPGLSLVAVPRTWNTWTVAPAQSNMAVTLDDATIAALAGKTFDAVWRVTLTTTTGCTASLDFPVRFHVWDDRNSGIPNNYNNGGGGA